MQNFAEYKIKNQISDNNFTQIFQAVDPDDKPFILKVLREEYLTPERIVKFQREFEISKIIQSENSIKSIDFFTHRGRPAIVFENFNGVTLLEYIQQNNGVKNMTAIKNNIEIAIELIKALNEIHEFNIIHRDINPSNILINPKLQQVRIIDFGLASEAANGLSNLKEYNTIEGTFAYISPEQTGRINRKVDYHSDYYSLGISLFELFTGSLPFTANNLREWVHCHVAKEALPLHEINPIIPYQLSNIIAKLISKNAELRYQSAYGLIYDLEHCLDELRKYNQIEPFVLGQKDVAKRFQIPEKLYGREHEVEKLFSYYNEVRKGNPGFLFIKGAAGIGKSALVDRLYSSVIEHHGNYVKSKFKQFDQSKPYSAIIQAFSQLVNVMLSEEETKIIRWKKLINDALLSNAQLIIDVIPDLELLIGKQPSVPKLSAVETKHRFVVSFKSFVGTFVKDGQPLLVFLDDLQWADIASIELIQNILSDVEIGPVLFVGTYRSQELLEDIQLFNSINSIVKSEIKTFEINVEGLKEKDIETLIHDIYSCEEKDSKALAALCLHKTGGNPFFLNEFLQNLNKNKLIVFSDLLGKWVCDIKKIKDTNVTANVIEIVSQQVLELCPATQHILKYASCVGSVFSTTMLAYLFDQKVDYIQDNLKSAVCENFILPVEDSYSYHGGTAEMIVEYGFLHERVRQAVYKLLSAEEKASIHNKIGWLLYQNITNIDDSPELFRVVRHINEGVSLLNSEELLVLAQLNLSAGIKAKSAGAFKSSFEHLLKGLKLVENLNWHEHYELKLQLSIQGAEAAYLCGDYEIMNQLSDTVLKNATSLIDQADIWEIKNLAQMAMHKHDLVEADTFDYLRKLGVVFPKKVTTLRLLYGLFVTNFRIRKVTEQQVLALPKVQDPFIEKAMQIMGVMVYPLYGGNPKLFVLMILKLLQLTLKHGTVPISPLSFMMYGMLLNAMLGKIDKGYFYGQIGLKLLKKIDAKKHWAEISVCNNLGVRIWKEPISNATDGLLDDYKIALETGDIEFAVSSLSSCSNYLFFQGKNLDDIIETANKYNRYLSHIPHSEGRRIMDMQLQAIEHLQLVVENPDILTGDFFNEEEFLVEDKASNESISANLYLLKGIVAYIYEDYENALMHIKKGRKYLNGVIGIMHYAMFVFYESLILSANYNVFTKLDKNKALSRIKKNQKKLRKWAEHAPMNFTNKVYLIEAELASIKGEFFVAGELYDKAIALSEEHKFIHEEAIANELAGKLWLKYQKPKFAKIYLAKAYRLYELWNAGAKLIQFKSLYRDLISSDVFLGKEQRGTMIHTSSGTMHAGSIDLETVIEAAQTISGEIVLSELLTKTLQIIMEHAGAQRGVLLIKDLISKDLLVEAEGNVQQETIRVELFKNKNRAYSLPNSIIRYVERSKKALVLDNASAKGNFVNDIYIKSCRAKSVLALPIVQQTKFLGVLYLENNLSTNLFNDKQTNVLKLLCTQLAVSIENARVYSMLEQKVNERTLEVEQQKKEIQKQAEDLTLSNSELKNLNATKDKLFSIIGHDLRNPFNAIIGFSKLLMINLDKMDREDIYSKVQLINKSSNKTYELLQNLLDWSRSQMGGIEFNPKQVLLFDVVNQIIALHKPSAMAKDIKLYNHIPPDVEIFADGDMLKVIIRNLLSNAIKFTNKGGAVNIDSEIHQKYIKVNIRDTGVGMSIEDMALLFNLEDARSTQGTDNEGGTGLGLILCKEFVEKNGGRISVDSNLGVGTAFKFTVPRYLESSIE